MSTNKWYTFTDASRRIGKNRNYFSNRYHSSPSYFDPTTIKIICGVKFINNDGINYVRKNIKKMVAHLNNTVFRWLILQLVDCNKRPINIITRDRGIKYEN